MSDRSDLGWAAVRLLARRLSSRLLAGAVGLGSRPRVAGRLIVPLGLVGSLAACEELTRFDNSDGSAFCGNIVPGTFVRNGFSPRTRMELLLDAEGFGSRPGRLRLVDDPGGPCSPKSRFDGEPLRESIQARADALSSMLFGDAQRSNLITWVDSTCDGTYLAVISLQLDGSVEVRLMNSRADEAGDEAGAFGVFRLTKHADGCAEER